MHPDYSPQSHAERLIAAGRVVLAVFSLLAVWLDPSAAMRQTQLLRALLPLYVLYALLLVVVEWSLRAPLLRLRLLTHAFDLGIFALFTVFGESWTSPFMVYFVFSLACATLRWQWRGTVWTAVAAFTLLIGMGVYAVGVQHLPTLELNRFLIRGMYLVVVATLLASMGEYEERVRREMSRLAAWPRVVPRETEALAREVIEHAAGILGAPRLLLTWDEPEEPWRYLAWWSAGEFRLTREPPTAFEPLVAEPLAETSFLCPDTPSEVSTVLHTSPGGLQRWRGAPLHPGLRAQLGSTGVLSLSLRGDTVEGRLFAADQAGMTSDDLVLGEIVARQAAARMDHFYLSRRLQEAAAGEERIRLARDLHDGVTQSLTATAIQLEVVRDLVATEPEAARERLAEIQRLIAAEHRELRSLIQHLKPALPGQAESSLDLRTRLAELAERIGRQWGVHVELKAEPLDDRVTVELADQVYRIVHEGVVNAGRHARASAVRVEVGADDRAVRIAVADDGRGFPFRGRYDLAALAERNLGPVILRQRVAALGGSLVVESTDRGARLDVVVPVGRKRTLKALDASHGSERGGAAGTAGSREGPVPALLPVRSRA